MIYLAYITGVIGMGVFLDGLASLWTYTSPERKDGQSWFRDHSLRVLRMVYGIALIVIGILMIDYI